LVPGISHLICSQTGRIEGEREGDGGRKLREISGSNQAKYSQKSFAATTTGTVEILFKYLSS
jgi:hypothetical protein